MGPGFSRVPMRRPLAGSVGGRCEFVGGQPLTRRSRGESHLGGHRALARGLAFLLLLLGSGLGCAASPPREGSYALTSFELEGTRALDSDETKAQLSTKSSPRLLGVPGLEGVLFEYTLLDESRLRADLLRIERLYRMRGYYEAKVTVARIVRDEAARTARVLLRIDEGEPVRVGRVVPSGLERLPAEVAFRTQRAIKLVEGQPFDEEVYERSRRDMLAVLADHGLPLARIEGRVIVDVARHTADVALPVEPGPPITIGPVTVVGLSKLPEAIVLQTLQLEPARPFRRSEVREAENALVDLGVFSSVSVEPEFDLRTGSAVPIRVRVKEAPLRSARAGLGLRIDPVQVTTGLRLGWEHRNFLGRLRRFSLDNRPSVSLYPTRTSRLEAPSRLLPANRLRAELRQPSFVEGRTTGVLSVEYNIYPLLFPLPPDKDPSDERIFGYHEFRSAVSLQRSFFDLRLMVAPGFSYQANVPLSYQAPPSEPGLPRGLDTLSIAYPELLLTLDLRDDRIRPKRGILLGNSLQVPGAAFGSDVSDVRVRPELRTYLPVSSRAVFATRLTFGFLFPRNYGQTLSDPNQIASDPSDPSVIADQQRLLFRAFYSGGPNSNRGYGVSEVGPHGPLGLLSDGTVNCFLSPGDPDCVRPLGGLTLWEASTEVRFDLGRSFGTVVFADASDVTRQVFGLRLFAPHLSLGLGFRYDTLIGPFRLDLGARVLERTRTAPPEGPIRDQAEMRPWFGSRYLPLSLHLALGESF